MAGAVFGQVRESDTSKGEWQALKRDRRGIRVCGDKTEREVDVVLGVQGEVLFVSLNTPVFSVKREARSLLTIRKGKCKCVWVFEEKICKTAISRRGRGCRNAGKCGLEVKVQRVTLVMCLLTRHV